MPNYFRSPSVMNRTPGTRDSSHAAASESASTARESSSMPAAAGSGANTGSSSLRNTSCTRYTPKENDYSRRITRTLYRPPHTPVNNRKAQAANSTTLGMKYW